jgi:hypothetical protein
MAAEVPMRAAALALLFAPALALAQARSLRSAPEPQGRYDAPLSLGVRLGGLVAYSSPAGAPSGVGGGIYGLFDLDSVLADVSADLWGGDKALQLAGGLGVYWPVAGAASTTPYLGGGAQLAWVKFGGEGAFGLQLRAALGLLASRRWSPHIRLELAWLFDTMSERERSGDRRHLSNGPIATIGLGF